MQSHVLLYDNTKQKKTEAALLTSDKENYQR